jgi:signal transduction histidine kinase
VHALGEHLRSLAASHDAGSRIAVSVSIDDRVLAQLQPHAKEVLLVVKEALSNIARHSGATTCSLTVRSEDGAAIVEIDDDGHGFDTSQTAAGLGLANAKRRAQAIGATYEIESGPDGTTVRFRLPA